MGDGIIYCICCSTVDKPQSLQVNYSYPKSPGGPSTRLFQRLPTAESFENNLIRNKTIQDLYYYSYYFIMVY